MLAGGLERSGQRNAGDPTFGPHLPLTNPPAAGGAGGLFTHTRTIQRLVYEQSQLKLNTSPHRQPVGPSQDWCDMV